jgi:hypothetical protein
MLSALLTMIFQLKLKIMFIELEELAELEQLGIHIASLQERTLGLQQS